MAPAARGEAVTTNRGISNGDGAREPLQHDSTLRGIKGESRAVKDGGLATGEGKTKLRETAVDLTRLWLVQSAKGKQCL